MTLTLTQLGLYAGALIILFLTPGPVWLALIARCMSGGMRQAVPLALGVVVGDVVWPLIVILGLGAIVASNPEFLTILRYGAGAILIWMGWVVIRSAGSLLQGNSRLTQPGTMAGFIAGLIAVGANPKASVFYIALMPGFFNVGILTWADIAIICGISFVIPLMGNLFLSLFVDRIRRFLQSPKALYRTNLTAGVLLVLVGIIIPFT